MVQLLKDIIGRPSAPTAGDRQIGRSDLAKSTETTDRPTRSRASSIKSAMAFSSSSPIITTASSPLFNSPKSRQWQQQDDQHVQISNLKFDWQATMKGRQHLCNHRHDQRRDPSSSLMAMAASGSHGVRLLHQRTQKCTATFHRSVASSSSIMTAIQNPNLVANV
ncbi:hypothetical protein ACLOJK_029542 [Asimina triloba]